MESSAQNIHEKLKVVDDYQTHHRLREATGRKQAEDLNERVLWWSLGQTAVLLAIGIGQVRVLLVPIRGPTISYATLFPFQVLVLRSFFTDKRSIPGGI